MRGRLGRPRRRGFTLVESIATIVVLATLGSAASFLIINSVDQYLNGAMSAQLQSELSIGLDRIGRELRKIELDSLAGPGIIAPNIDTVTQGSSPGTMDWRDDTGDLYRLALVGTDVQLTVDGAGPYLLLTDCNSLVIQTYDDANDPIPGATISGTTCDVIRRIRVTVTLNRNDIQQDLHVKVYLRATMSGAPPAT